MNKEFQLPETEEKVFFMQNSFDFETNKAYIKQELINDSQVWSIYNYQGEKMGYAASRDVAFAIVNQNALIGLSVH